MKYEVHQMITSTRLASKVFLLNKPFLLNQVCHKRWKLNWQFVGLQEITLPLVVSALLCLCDSSVNVMFPVVLLNAWELYLQIKSVPFTTKFFQVTAV